MNPRHRAARCIVTICLAIVSLNARQLPTETSAEHDARMQWWREARFGMFIHWGLYAIPAGEWAGKTDYAEWIRTNAEIPLSVYDTLVGHFNPVRFDADAWVRVAKNAGMKDIVLTSKHHDGFCLFDTKQTDFNVMHTPFHRDIVRELADACKREGIRFCLYHSIMDWHHPDYLPRRTWEKERPTASADFSKYVLYLKNELGELLTNYGPLGVLWFDGEWESTWNESFGKDLYAYVRKLQPAIIVNNRVGVARTDMSGMTAAGGFGGDFGTPEQEVPATGMPGVDWESCMTMNDHWGYNKNDKNFKSTTELIRTLVDIASKGGNFLLNVGPTAEGVFPVESIVRLQEIGEWMNVNGSAIYGTTASPFKDLSWGRCTQKTVGNSTLLYLHVFDWPSDGRLIVPGLLSDPQKASLLSDGSGKLLRTIRDEDAVVVLLPTQAPSKINSVVVLEVDGKPDVNDPPVIEPVVNIFVDTASVTVSSGRANVDIRYTLDGKTPTATSPLAHGTVELTTSATLSARCYRGSAPVSGTSALSFRKVAPHQPTSVPEAVAGVGYSLYEGDWDTLPDFNSFEPVTMGQASEFTLEPRRSQEHFGLVYAGFLRVPQNGVYTLSTSSDDGSRLWVDDSLVVDNDGLHGLAGRKGSIALGAGLHPFRLAYFNKTGGLELRVDVSGPGIQKTPIPAGMLFMLKR